MQRRITAGSSLAETTITGTLGYCARRYIRPEKPRTPGMVRSSRTRSTSPPRSSSSATSSKEPASAMSTRSNRPDTASRNAPRNSGWSSAITSDSADSSVSTVASLANRGPTIARLRTTCHHALRPQPICINRLGQQAACAALVLSALPMNCSTTSRLCGRRAVLDQIDALPGAERELAAGDRHMQRDAGEHRLDMRRHVVGPFGVVDPGRVVPARGGRAPVRGRSARRDRRSPGW